MPEVRVDKMILRGRTARIARDAPSEESVRLVEQQHGAPGGR
jgi:hypothetical protein